MATDPIMRKLVVLLLASAPMAACHRAPVLPPVPAAVRSPADSSQAALARALAPVLYVQRDEYFPLERVVAIVHPERPIIAYVLLWQWDVHGQWLPWTKSSDEEEVWVGYDPETHAPTDVWTYWHGNVLHADWTNRGPPAFDVQWGKHGSLPRGVIESDLPHTQSLNLMYALDFVLLPDIWMGKLIHGGPWGFFHGYGRYREFTRVMPLDSRLNVVLSTDEPAKELETLLGHRYSHKQSWPALGE